MRTEQEWQSWESTVKLQKWYSMSGNDVSKPEVFQEENCNSRNFWSCKSRVSVSFIHGHHGLEYAYQTDF